jgi:threonine dehydrogenase-like Zn-dependent dehydrogenase
VFIAASSIELLRRPLESAQGAEVTVMDTRDDRLTFAADHLGADLTLHADSSAEQRVKEATDGDGFDVVIDSTGNVTAMERGFGFLAHGGRYVLVSVVRENVTFSDPEFHKREGTLLASRNAQPDDFAEVVRQMQAGKVPARALNTHHGPLAQAPELFAMWMDPGAGVIKAILEI